MIFIGMMLDEHGSCRRRTEFVAGCFLMVTRKFLPDRATHVMIALLTMKCNAMIPKKCGDRYVTPSITKPKVISCALQCRPTVSEGYGIAYRLGDAGMSDCML